MGAEKQTKGRVGRRPNLPCPPPGAANARRTGNQPGKPPLRFPQWQSEQVPRGFSRRNAGGVRPPQKKQRLQAKKSAKKP